MFKLLKENLQSSKCFLVGSGKGGSESLPECSVCGREFPESQLRRCYDCGKAYCPECAEKDPTIKELGVCPDCEEVFEAEEDYWGWGEEEEW